MKRAWKFILAVIVVSAIVAAFLIVPEKENAYEAAPGNVVELTFELDKKFEFGEYYFNLDNGQNANYPLCFCLTEKNTYPPDCSGDVTYLYKNAPGTMCIPLKIGSGRCSVAPISTLGYATSFMVPLEYSWTKPFQKILLGIRVPPQAPGGAKLVVAVSVFKQSDKGQLQSYRLYEKTIKVKQAKGNS